MQPLSYDTLQTNLESDRKFRERRHSQWTDNYTLYRDTVIVNRLTQRQSVNVPLMKESMRTILSGIDDPPDNYYENLDNDKQKELFMNEYWKWVFDMNKLEIKDIIDKKQVLLYGRSFIKLNIVNGQFYVEVLDPQDVLVDRYIDPSDIETARRVIHTGIFSALSDVAQNPMYDQEAITKLKEFFATNAGLIKNEENTRIMQDKNQRMSDMGVPDANNPILGETYVELNEHYVKVWDEEAKEDKIILCVTAEGQVLMQKPLKEVMNINFYPFVTWADDIERTDFWSDGWADVARVPNQVLNVWLSQLVENRTLRNFGMNFYNSSIEGFNPTTYQPAPFGWYPIPAGKDGDIQKVLKRVEVPDLSESLDEMQFLIGMVERSTAATAIEKGESPEGQVTLGEVKLLDAKAQKRITSMSKFYRQVWKDLGDKFVMIVEANPDKLDAVKLYKKSVNGNYFAKELKPEDWKSKSGYKTRVTTLAEKEQDSIDSIQKMKIGVTEFPTNQPLREIYQKKILDWMGLSPDETKEVMEFEKQQVGMMQQMPGMPGQGLPGQGMPALPAPQGVTLDQILTPPTQINA
ncbi:MAG TPA: hypothetical protein VJ464_13435 [Blastocatellia bacterium]|nr:hypothetical protein [Blastocatellia bacterium]